MLLEKDSTASLNIHNIMCELRGIIKNRIDLKFYGGDIKKKLEKRSRKAQEIFEKEVVLKTLFLIG